MFRGQSWRSKVRVQRSEAHFTVVKTLYRLFKGLTERQNVSDFGSLSEGRRENRRIFFRKFEGVFDLGHDEADDLPAQDAGDGVELVVGRDVRVPTVRILNGKPLLAESFDFAKVAGVEKPELDFGRVQKWRAVIALRVGRAELQKNKNIYFHD
jgi:hypothetical protein